MVGHVQGYSQASIHRSRCRRHCRGGSKEVLVGVAACQGQD